MVSSDLTLSQCYSAFIVGHPPIVAALGNLYIESLLIGVDISVIEKVLHNFLLMHISKKLLAKEAEQDVALINKSAFGVFESQVALLKDNFLVLLQDSVLQQRGYVVLYHHFWARALVWC